MGATIQQVEEFIAEAMQKHRYTTDSGRSMIYALKVFKEVLRQEEQNDVGFITKHADDITDRIKSKPHNTYTDASLMTYRSRVVRAIKDYSTYGNGVSESSQAKGAVNTQAKSVSPSTQKHHKNVTPTSLQLSLRNDREVVIKYPIDLSVVEADAISNILKNVAKLKEV